jgi:uncharacterized Zn finger protein
MASWYSDFWQPYVPVAERRRQAAKYAASLEKKGRKLEPVRILGRNIASTFWGKSWCENLERYSDYANRLPRGRTYVRNGSVIDLQVLEGRVEALVSGSTIYKTSIDFTKLSRSRWKAVKAACGDRIDSVVDLLRGTFSDGVMQVLTAEATGLFPSPKEIDMDCSCPDWADMCKHVAAVLYGVGARLDTEPELFFRLRGVDHGELISEAAGAAVLAGAGADGSAEMSSDEVERVFGIEIAPRGESKPRPQGRRGASQGLPPARETSERVPTAATARGRAARVNGGRRAKARARPEASSQAVRGRERQDKVPRGRPRVAEAAPPVGDGALGVRVVLLRGHFRSHETLTNADYRALCGVGASDATRDLTRLAGQGFLHRRGQKRGTYYVRGFLLG